VHSIDLLQYFSTLAGIIAGNDEEYRGVALEANIVNTKATKRRELATSMMLYLESCGL